MGKIAADIANCIDEMAGDSRTARFNLRVNQVRSRYKAVIELVYGDVAPLFLAHTNNVYIMDKKGVCTLIVYVDESIFAAELNAQRELIKLHLLQRFGEPIKEFEIHVSKPHYKNLHPYLSEDSENTDEKPSAIPLDDTEKSYVSNTVSHIDDKSVREAVRKAMTADLEWKKGEKRTR